MSSTGAQSQTKSACANGQPNYDVPLPEITYEWLGGSRGLEASESPLVMDPLDSKNLRDRIARIGAEFMRRTESPKAVVAAIQNPNNYYFQVFCPPPPGITRGEHEAVLIEWAIEEALASALLGGTAFETVVECAKIMAARRLLAVLEKADASMRLEGDRLWIGPASAVSPEARAMIPLVKQQIMEVLGGRESTTGPR